VAFEVARELGVPFDVFLVRKLGAPGQEELAMGAIASGGTVVLNDEVIEALRITPEMVEAEIAYERVELSRRERLYRGERPPLDVFGRTVILVDDGLATGSTMRAAVQALRRASPQSIVVAVPTAAPSTCEEFQTIADACICTITPEPFRAVGLWYENFDQISDEEVCHLLFRARLDPASEPPQDLRLLPPTENASQPTPH
jgi:predicted phosphoribosyltransferase